MDFDEIRRTARAQGFTEEPPEVGINFLPPDEGMAIVNGNPIAQGRELRNLLHQLRRSGLRWPATEATKER